MNTLLSFHISCPYFSILPYFRKSSIVHRMGPHECEGVAGGTAQELRSTRCVEVCGDNVVERLALDLDEWPEVWPSDDPAPVLVITIGGKEAKP